MAASLKHILLLALLIIAIHNQSFRLNRYTKRNIKYMDQIMRAFALSANTASQIILGNQQNYLYYINVNVGTPFQNFNVVFDTGSNIAWLPLAGSGSNITFNSALSSTFNNTSEQGQIQYADNSGVFGTMGSDVLNIPNTNINVVQPFLWVTQEVNFDGFPSFVAGLFGMGFTTTPNFLDLAYQQNQISTPAFTLSIVTTSNTIGSFIYYDNIPESIQNSTYFMPVSGSDYWQVQVIGAIVGGIDMSSYTSNVAVIDSGTSYFYINQNLYNRIMKSFFLECVVDQGTPVCLCSSTSTWPQFNFLFDGIEVYIPSSQYIGIIDISNNLCTYNFGVLSTIGDQLLLGDIFFQGYNITFNKLTQEVGFSGNVGVLQKVIPLGANLTQYILLGIIILIGLFGIGTFGCMNDMVGPSGESFQYQISTYNQTGRPQSFAGKRVVFNN